MSKSEYIQKSHNVSVLIYHFVLPAKYRRVIFSAAVDYTIKEICLEITKRYEIHFLEIGTDNDHVHFLIQSVPTYSTTKIVTIVKSLTAREIFRRNPEVKEALWGGEFWSDGYFVNTVSKYGNEETIMKYVKSQGKEKEYKVLHKIEQLVLF
jgi:REP element-mobilizing transposase RayT